MQDVASKVLKTPIVLNAEELMDLSEPLRKEIAKLMAKKRISTQPVTEQMYSAGETQPESDPCHLVRLVMKKTRLVRTCP